MSSGPLLSWIDTNGWLVLSGSADALSEIRAQALSRVNVDGAIAYISLLGDLGDSLMDDMIDLGAPAGYFVDLEDSDNNEIYERLRRASIIVIEPGSSINHLKRLMTQTVIQAIKDGLERGALVLFEGIASGLAGERLVNDNGQLIKGLNFIYNTFISPDVDSVLESSATHEVYAIEPETVFIGVQRGSALVLGPQGHIETWGDKQVTISLGSSGSGDSDWSGNNN